MSFHSEVGVKPQKLLGRRLDAPGEAKLRSHLRDLLRVNAEFSYSFPCQLLAGHSSGADHPVTGRRLTGHNRAGFVGDKNGLFVYVRTIENDTYHYATAKDAEPLFVSGSDVALQLDHATAKQALKMLSFEHVFMLVIEEILNNLTPNEAFHEAYGPDATILADLLLGLELNLDGAEFSTSANHQAPTGEA